jgi:ribosome-associated translation inhibitor RaiA
MQIQPEITFKEVQTSDALNAKIQDWLEKLEHVYAGIIRCQILVEQPHRHHRQGRHYHVRIRLTVPGVELVSSHDPGPNETHEDPYVAVRDAFLAMRRQLEDYARKPRSDWNRAALPRTGTVVYIDPEGSWGWLEADAHRVRFTRDVIEGGIDRLAIGDEVTFSETETAEATHIERLADRREQMPAMSSR